MKYKGQTVKNDNIRHVVIPRPSGDIIFIAKPVVSFDGFDEFCLEPKPPIITIHATGEKRPDLDDTNFKLQLIKYNAQRTHWLILESLKDTPDIVWETVEYSKPDTWSLFIKEFEDSGFTPAEINAITNAVMTVNSLNETQLEEARKRFLALNTAQAEQ